MTDWEISGQFTATSASAFQIIQILQDLNTDVSAVVTQCPEIVFCDTGLHYLWVI